MVLLERLVPHCDNTAETSSNAFSLSLATRLLLRSHWFLSSVAEAETGSEDLDFFVGMCADSLPVYKIKRKHTKDRISKLPVYKIDTPLTLVNVTYRRCCILDVSVSLCHYEVTYVCDEGVNAWLSYTCGEAFINLKAYFSTSKKELSHEMC